MSFNFCRTVFHKTIPKNCQLSWKINMNCTHLKIFRLDTWSFRRSAWTTSHPNEPHEVSGTAPQPELVQENSWTSSAKILNFSWKNPEQVWSVSWTGSGKILNKLKNLLHLFRKSRELVRRNSWTIYNSSKYSELGSNSLILGQKPSDLPQKGMRLPRYREYCRGAIKCTEWLIDWLRLLQCVFG